MTFSLRTFSAFAGVLLTGALLPAQSNAGRMVVERGGETIVVEPYGPNIVHVSLSMQKNAALAAPGYGFIAKPATEGWNEAKNERGDDVLRSPQVVVTLEGWGAPQKPNGAVAPDPAMWAPLGKHFGGTTPGAHITLTTAEGKKVVEMLDWTQAIPNQKDGTSYLEHERRPSDDPFYVVGANFASPDDEHYYGLGQNQEGFLDHRGHVVRCWDDYNAPGGQSSCIPFMITNKGYGIVWDNASKTTIAPGFNERTSWMSEAGDRVSYFIIVGKTAEEIFAGYRQLTGATPIPPKSTLGLIQCKQRYFNQQEVLDVAKGYRDRKLPADVLVVDWFYYTKMGQMDFDPKYWPDPAAMNKQLHAMGFDTMISVWPRFLAEDRYYADLRAKGWLIQKADGTPADGLPYDKAGSDIDTTNPEAAKWYWNVVKDNILSQGFDSLWTDETEPDVPVNGAYYKIGPGTRYFNIYPYFHVGNIYDNMRAEMPNKRALIMTRDVFTGVQSQGSIFWSSDIAPTWDTLKRQVPTGLGVTASGYTYWSNDTGGWGFLPAFHTPAHKPLLDPEPARKVIGGYDDYVELYTRWFEYASFLPIFRVHGSRAENEVWSYGPQAEPILEKYLKLRYDLMPYIYSLGYQSWKTGTPFMQALPLVFPNDPNVTNLGDEYMFGPAFLVAPVTEQGATSRKVYLPAGSDWYNYWTGKRIKGGQSIIASAPIDTLPLFVKAGSILPIGSKVLSTHEKQTVEKLRVYPGQDGSFTLFNDDGTTYAYEKGAGEITNIHWNNATGKLTHEGPGLEQSKIEIVK